MGGGGLIEGHMFTKLIRVDWGIKSKYVFKGFGQPLSMGWMFICFFLPTVSWALACSGPFAAYRLPAAAQVAKFLHSKNAGSEGD